MLTYSEENYLKTIFHLSLGQKKGVSTNAIAAKIETKASSVTDMIKKLNEKQLIKYQKYQGVTLTAEGIMAAKMIVRKHRLWEVFLVEKLGFNWDEVHDVAEELEHIKSEKLINKLDAFLEYPTQDPHGDPIPNAKGEIKLVDKQLLSEIDINTKVVCVGVKDSSSEFLQYLDKHKISLGTVIEIVDIEPFDQSYTIGLHQHTITITKKIASNLYVKVISA
ncbi:metal-dependent transcriptional regulator [Myroides pelagicus]|uniref:Transcriptional regulator MntR n=1 Tax=Myroides pelagicus TaxID=270914 RepID=A0A7K1GL88_9FLAO|nr:metal-dependent transcriptional regulator [Myroides pelagicus]MEC4112757.1 metal-dependent transcriptional regulator [Myroides pelagicus]MTH29652.1 metal-dependent transcriptional regulator [Myroides pelagicus]